MRWTWAIVLLTACGDDLASQLVRVSPEPPGSHCANGGTAVAVGLDRNGDGTLQDGEVDRVDYVCDGNGGQGGTLVLIDTQTEPAGANCSAGGIAVRTGLDLDADQLLDDNEVQHVSFICNAVGHAALVETHPEPAGIHCSLGGTVLVVGVDLDDDGALDPAEVTGTSFLCTVAANATLDGSYTANNTLDIALLAGVRTITGTLSMGTRLPDVELPDLESVGAIFLRGDVIRLPALRVVGGTASFGQCHHLEASVLDSVGGTLGASDAQDGGPVLDVLDLPRLRTIDGDLIVSTQVVHVRLPALERVTNVQPFWPVLTELDLSSLQHAGTLSLAPPPLAAVQLPKLRDASQLSFSVDNATLIDLPSLISVGVLHIDASVLTTLQMPAVTSIGGPVTIATPQLSTCQINAILAQANYTGPRTIQAAPCP